MCSQDPCVSGSFLLFEEMRGWYLRLRSVLPVARGHYWCQMMPISSARLQERSSGTTSQPGALEWGAPGAQGLGICIPSSLMGVRV